MTADIGHGCDLQRSSNGTSGGTFATVGTIYEMSPPGATRDAVDKTSHSSTDRWREFIGGMKELGDMQIDLEFDPASTAVDDMYTDLNTNTAGYYKVVFNDVASTEWGFSAFVTGVDVATPLEDKRMMTVTIKGTGKPAWIA